MTQIALRLPAELDDSLRAMCDASGLSKSDLIRRALELFVEKSRQNGQIVFPAPAKESFQLRTPAALNDARTPAPAPTPKPTTYRR